ncbi:MULTISPECIES: acyl carrier protein [unclassified Streptomyces]|uniref:acyl carrier protein n=1 Tax=unclassified Streptomyces TaxID=2593676 RepID=UPI0033A9517C
MTSSTPWLQELSDTPLSERRARLESFVVAEFKRELLMDETDVLPPHVSYFELGLTSLGATDTRQRLERELGRPLDAAFLFNHPTVGHLVDFLTTEVIPELFAPPAGRTADDPARQAPATDATKDLVDDVLKELYR